MLSSSGRTRRTSGSGSTCGGPEMAITGCMALISRGRPQYGRSSSHRPRTSAAGPTIDEQRRVKPGLADPGADEHVDHRVAVAQLDDLIAIAVVEQAQRRRSPRLGAQHTPSVSAEGPGGLQPTRYRAQQVTAPQPAAA